MICICYHILCAIIKLFYACRYRHEGMWQSLILKPNGTNHPQSYYVASWLPMAFPTSPPTPSPARPEKSRGIKPPGRSRHTGRPGNVCRTEELCHNMWAVNGDLYGFYVICRGCEWDIMWFYNVFNGDLWFLKWRMGIAYENTWEHMGNLAHNPNKSNDFAFIYLKKWALNLWETSML